MNELRDRLGLVEAWAGLPKKQAIKDLAQSGTQHLPYALRGFSAPGVPLPRCATGDPPEKETAAPMGIGSGGEQKKSGAISKTQEYCTDLCTATAPRIIRTHWGVS